MHRTSMVLTGILLVLGTAATHADSKIVQRVGPDTALVHIGPKDGGTKAFVAWPAGKGPVSAVVVAHEWWGLNAQIRSVAERLAGQGYVAIVPDLYHGKVATDAETAHELSRGLEPESARSDFEAAIQWLRLQDRSKKAAIGAIGFCMGGRLAQELAITHDAIAAVVMFYGRPITEEDRIAKLKVPLQGHFGADDRGIPVERVKAFEDALKKAGKRSDIYVYPGAGHAFMNESRESHRADAARQAWARTLAFFHKHLKG